jgi:hypothetical protein
MRYVASQTFTKPRFLILVERLDLICASPELADLAALRQPIDLTTNRDRARPARLHRQAATSTAAVAEHG